VPARVATRHATGGIVCSVDHLASSAGVAAMRAGGNAVDAAIATSAVLAVTTQQMCGMGGDLFALVQQTGDAPLALCAAGRAGSGASSAALRADGHTTVPIVGDVRAATVPGCVDGWVALHERGARLGLTELLAPAVALARGGFPASPLLARAIPAIAHLDGADDYRRDGGIRPGDRIRRPVVADVLESIGTGGRGAFYGGPFGRGLLEVGAGLFSAADLVMSQAEWVKPLGLRAWGHQLWTMPPPSQGYLSLAGAWIAEGLPLPESPADPGWAHLLVEAARWAGHDRPDVLFDGADGEALLARDELDRRRSMIDPERRTSPAVPTAGGGTIYLCTADGDGGAVSLIQSNAAGWGCHVVVPGTGIFLHDRALGFSLETGHPAELAPGRRPPHTLSPALVTHGDGRLAHVVGTMGGDMQPQVVVQLVARLLHGGESPGAAVSAPRWVLGNGGFRSWTGEGEDHVSLEEGAPEAWAEGLRSRGHEVQWLPPTANVGHAHVISRSDDGVLGGAGANLRRPSSNTAWTASPMAMPSGSEVTTLVSTRGPSASST
jgi:gamma-glutamyltranspeptidase / glutathione hydrolase